MVFESLLHVYTQSLVDRELKLRKKGICVIMIINNAIWYDRDLKLLWCVIIKKHSLQAKIHWYFIENYY